MIGRIITLCGCLFFFISQLSFTSEKDTPFGRVVLYDVALDDTMPDRAFTVQTCGEKLENKIEEALILSVRYLQPGERSETSLVGITDEPSLSTIEKCCKKFKKNHRINHALIGYTLFKPDSQTWSIKIKAWNFLKK